MLLISETKASPQYLSPCTVTPSADVKTLYIACATANKVLSFDADSGKVLATIDVPASPSGLVVGEKKLLYVTCGGPEGKVCVIDTAKCAKVGEISVGHTPCAPVLAGDLLFVCNRFNNDVGVVDLKKRKQISRIPVEREPFAMDLTKDGKFLLVANMLPAGRADQDQVAAVVTVIDVATKNVLKRLQLPNGSGSLNGVCVSPDGKFAAVTHILARFHLPASQVDRGWMNANALTIIDTTSMNILNTVLLDNPENGAANPWGVAWSADSTRLLVAHSGTHEVSVIDFPKLLSKLNSLPSSSETNRVAQYSAALTRESVSHDLSFLTGLRQRIRLTDGDNGPRGLAVVGGRVFTANYFSDTLSSFEVAAERPHVTSMPLGSKSESDIVRKGEIYFHDARLCFQNWQSCASCHPGDARADALNWDLLNDGIGNPKNNKSLLLAHKTPPSMSLGIRDTAEVAVRSGIRFILFTKQPEEVAVAIDEYLKSLKPVLSPHLVKGELSAKAQKGQKIFKKSGCADCHPAPLFTDLEHYDVGTLGKYDKPADKFDTPTLVEVWRTAPYLHDGSALTVHDVVKQRNKEDQHGKTSTLSDSEIDCLCEYVLSL